MRGGVTLMNDDERVRALYRAPIDGFIAARDELVTELRAAGQAERAAVVKKLRKPSVPAWALNQLADRNPEGIQALIDAGAEVRAAQQAALTSDRNADRLREATAGRRQAVTALAGLVSDILLEVGRSPNAHLSAIRATLEAASVEPEAAERLRAGTLEREIKEPVGFGEVLGLRSVTDESEAPSDVEGGEKQGRADDDSLRAELGRLHRELNAAAKKARLARQMADRLSGQLATQQSRLDDLSERHAAAEARALEAELEKKRAEDAVSQRRA